MWQCALKVMLGGVGVAFIATGVLHGPWLPYLLLGVLVMSSMTSTIEAYRSRDYKSRWIAALQDDVIKEAGRDQV